MTTLVRFYIAFLLTVVTFFRLIQTKDQQLKWYGFGQELSESSIPLLFSEHFHKTTPGFVPTTYDASRAYLDAELEKPKGQRDLLKAMCVILPLKIPKNRKLHLIMRNMNSIMPIYQGISPTFDPLASFDAFVTQAI